MPSREGLHPRCVFRGFEFLTNVFVSFDFFLEELLCLSLDDKLFTFSSYWPRYLPPAKKLVVLLARVSSTKFSRKDRDSRDVH